MNTILHSLYLDMAERHAASALRWREIAERTLDLDPRLAAFALQQAQEREAWAAEDKARAEQFKDERAGFAA